MYFNNKRPEGERYLRGEGPRRIKVVGGSGRRPTYEDAAAEYHVYLSMTSVMRLRMMSYLCVMGPMRIPALARALDLPEISVRTAMWGLKETWAVAGRPNEIKRGYSRSRTGGCWAMDWEATETGRKWLFRYGWVTRRIGWDFEWIKAGYEGRCDVMPWDVLRDHAEPTLLRPVALAVMQYLTRCPPEQGPRMAEELALGRCVVEQYLRRWWRLGWVEKTQNAVEARSYFSPGFVEPAPRWELLERGKQAVERHTAAMRWASQTAGYEPPADDAFFNDRDACWGEGQGADGE